MNSIYNKPRAIFRFVTIISFVFIFTLVVFHTPVFAAAGINKQINFQGKVTNTNGTNVADGDYDFVFKLYTVDTAGSAVWTETKTLTVTDGVFQTNLGDTTALPGSVDFNTDNIYLGIEFDSDGEMDPRVRFTAAPYAFNALKVAGLTVTNTTGTLTVTNGKTLTVSDSTTLGSNSITFGGTEVLTLAASKNVTFADSFTTSGANSLTLTTTGSTDVTLPTTGTLATLAGSESLSNKTLVSPIITTSPTAAGATWTNLGTVTTVDINGGTVDGTVIGGSSAAAGTFTTLTATGNTTLGDSNTTDTLTGNLLTSSITSGATTQTAFSLAAASLTTGEILDITSTSAASDGSDNEAIDINLTYAPTSSDGTFRGIDLAVTETSNTLTNEIYGIKNLVALNGNANKTGVGILTNLTSSATTSESLTSLDVGVLSTGAGTGSASKSIIGVLTHPSHAAASGTSTIDVYGAYAAPSATLFSTGATVNVYGQYISTTASGAAGCSGPGDCTIRQYGLYIANGTSSSANNIKYGIYVETPTGAGTNYAAVFAGGNIGVGDTTPDFLLDIQTTASQSMVIDAASTDNTTTSGVFDLNVDTATDANIGLNLDYILRDSAGISAYASTITATIDNDTGHNSTAYGLRILGDSDDAGSTLYGLYIDADNDGGGEGTEIAAEFRDGLVNIGNGTDYSQFSTVGDLTFVDANDASTITGPNGGALNIVAANSQNLALSTTTAGNITLTTAAGSGLANILTGNLKVGNGTPSLTQDGEDGYIEGTFEVDGTATFGGSVGIGTTSPGSFVLNAAGAVRWGTSGGNQSITFAGSANSAFDGGIYEAGTGSVIMNIGANDGNLGAVDSTRSGGFFRVDVRGTGGGSPSPILDMYARPGNSGTLRNVFSITEVASTNNVKTSLYIYQSTGSVGLCHANNTTGLDEIVDCASTPAADYMEMYSVENDADLGTVVAPSTQTIITNDGEPVSKLTKTITAYQNNVIGIVSDKTKAGDFNSIGYNIKESDNPQPIAVSGRVPVKVSNSSPNIKAGDFVTTSNEPGKAMKATKSGQMIGKALEDWNPNSGKDKVMVYVINSFGDPNNALANLVINSDGTLVLPKLSAEKIVVSELDVSILKNNGVAMDLATIIDATSKISQLSNDSDLVHNELDTLAQNQNNTDQKVLGLETETASHSAKIAEIKSLSEQAISQNSITDEKLASASGRLDSLSQVLDDLKETTPASVFSQNQLFIEGDATVSGQLTAGTLHIRDSAIVESMLNVVDTITASRILISDLAQFMKDVIFKGNVEFIGRATFNNDTAGTAMIKTGQSSIEVKFDQKYPEIPVITATLVIDKVDKNEGESDEDWQNRQASLEGDILSADYRYAVVRKTDEGFVIKLNKSAEKDLKFSWSAVSIKNPKLTSSD